MGAYGYGFAYAAVGGESSMYYKGSHKDAGFASLLVIEKNDEK